MAAHVPERLIFLLIFLLLKVSSSPLVFITTTTPPPFSPHNRSSSLSSSIISSSVVTWSPVRLFPSEPVSGGIHFTHVLQSYRMKTLIKTLVCSRILERLIAFTSVSDPLDSQLSIARPQTYTVSPAGDTGHPSAPSSHSTLQLCSRFTRLLMASGFPGTEDGDERSSEQVTPLFAAVCTVAACLPGGGVTLIFSGSVAVEQTAHPVELLDVLLTWGRSPNLAWRSEGACSAEFC
ncbi:unnamed protein product [Pleuronectes platessa]|uniref:Uncharacterized protein n=1 Tax=Pleuronectes platessa TaxID=8262 RepID=A0A9N7UJU7_PLEPL|nr:unnamed protein product [Pleuronectes platessa]